MKHREEEKKLKSYKIQKNEFKKGKCKSKRLVCMNNKKTNNLNGGFYIGSNPTKSFTFWSPFMDNPSHKCTAELEELTEDKIKQFLKDKTIIGYIPLFELPFFLAKCGIKKYALLDYKDNHIYFEPNIIEDTEEFAILKIMDTLQIQLVNPRILKTEYLKKYNVKDFKTFIESTCQYTSNDYISLYANMFFKYHDKYLERIIINSNKLVKFTSSLYNKYIEGDYLEVERNINLENFRKLLFEFIRPIYVDGVFITFEYHNNINIVKFFTFINDIYMLYDIIDINYYNYNDYFSIAKYGNIQSINTSEINIYNLQNQKFKNTITIDILKKKIKQTLSGIENNLETLLKFISTNSSIDYIDILNLDLLNKDLNIFSTTYDKINASQKKQEIMKNNVLFYKTIRMLRGLLKNKDGDIDIFKVELIVNTFNYFILSENVRQFNIIKENNIKKEEKVIGITKKIVKQISFNKNIVLFKFIEFVSNYITKINLIREEFVQNNIVFYNEWIKLAIGQAYYNYLGELQQNSSLPISLESHKQSYTTNNQIRDIYIKNEYMFPEVIKFTILPEKQIIIIKNTVEYKFNSCGETNLLNFIKYLLFDLEKNYITPEMLTELKQKYPNNLLGEIFNENLLKYDDDISQTNYLTDKLNYFADLISLREDEPENTKLYNKIGRIELIPSLENSVIILKKIFGEQENTLTNKEYIQKLSRDFIKKIIKINLEQINYKGISFNFNEKHGYTEKELEKNNYNKFTSFINNYYNLSIQKYQSTSDNLYSIFFQNYSRKIKEYLNYLSIQNYIPIYKYSEFFTNINKKIIYELDILLTNNQYDFNSILEYLPEHINQFHIKYENYNIKKLKSTTKFLILNNINQIENDTQTFLPSGLEYLKVYDTKINFFPPNLKCFINFGNNENIIYNSLPITLTSLSLNRYNNIVFTNNLPNLKNFEISAEQAEFPNYNIFPSVENLLINGFRNYLLDKRWAPNLPHSLKIFENNSDGLFSFYPPSLLKLSLIKFDSKLLPPELDTLLCIKFCENLLELKLIGWSKLDFLPNSLKLLELKECNILLDSRIINKIPLEKIIIYDNYNQFNNFNNNNLDVLPDSINEMVLHYPSPNFSKLPTNLKSISVMENQELVEKIKRIAPTVTINILT
jgi:hypothetical protein